MDRHKLALLLHDFVLPAEWTSQSAVAVPHRVTLVSSRGEPVVHLYPYPDLDLMGVGFETADSGLEFDLRDPDDFASLAGVLDRLRRGSVEVFVRSLRGHRRAAAGLRCGTLEINIPVGVFTAFLPGRWERLPPAVSVIVGSSR